MRARESFDGNLACRCCCYWLLVLIIGVFDRLLLCTSMPTTTITTTLEIPTKSVIRTPGNNFLQHLEHVNKTCLLSSLSAIDCHESVNMEHLHDLRQHMRLEVEPCEDFYQYACGNWAKHDKHQKTTNMMKFGDEQIVKQYVELFAQSRIKPNPTLSGNLIFSKILHYYNVCQRYQHSRTSLTLRGYAEALHSLGVWNASDTWLDTLARLGRFGYAEHFVQLHIKQHNVSQHEVQILPHNRELRVKLNREIFDIISIYTHHTYVSLERAFGQLEDDLEAIIKKSSTDCTSAELDEDNECDLFRYYSYDQLIRSAPTIDWQRFIALHLARSPQANDVFAVDALRTIERLVHHIQGVDGELRLIYTVVRFLNYVQSHLQILRTPQADSIDKRCVRHMRKTLYLPMLHVYEVAFYAPRRVDNDRLISRIFQQLKSTFALTLTRNDMQLSADSIDFLLAKLKSLRLNMGNLPQSGGQQLYEQYVEKLEFGNNFYHNHLLSLEHYYDRLRLVAQPNGGRNKFPDWYTFNCHSPEMPDNVDSTAYYYVLNNMIVMPYAYLQRPFFDNSFWPALLYGDLANTLGHEMMHAFDNNFLIYDHAGNMADNYKEIFANAEFRRRLNILQPGTQFLSERIADISGSRLALQTFLSDAHFRHNNGKLYFLQFAQFFCGSEENISETQLYDPDHDINSARLNYVVAHLSEFTHTFECPVGSAMNLKQRHKMW